LGCHGPVATDIWLQRHLNPESRSGYDRTDEVTMREQVRNGG
jgi:hypothetical protein